VIYTRFKPAGPRQWAVLCKTLEVAKVILSPEGHCTVTHTGAALNPEALASVQDFVICRERAASTV